MTDDSSQDTQPVTESQPLPPSPGPMLKAAREKAGLQTAAIARELHINTAKLDALERDHYEQLPSEVFIQGYVRRYAKLVGLHEQEMADVFSTYVAALRGEREEQEDDVVEAFNAPAKQLPSWLAPVGLWVGAGLLLGLVVWFVVVPDQQQVEPQNANQPQSSATQELVATQAIETQDNSSAATSETAVANDSAAESIGAEQSASQQVPVIETTDDATSPDDISANDVPETTASDVENSAPVAVPESANSSSLPTSDLTNETNSYSEGELRLTLNDDCWVKVTDATGEVIYARLVGNGESVDLTGLVPMEVMLGNARAAELSFNGEPIAVNLSPGRDTAKVIVGG